MGWKMYVMGGSLAVAVVAVTAWYHGKIEEAELRGQLHEAAADLEAARTARDSVEAVLVPRLVRLTAENVSLVARQETLESNLNIAHRSARTWRRRYDEVRNDSSATVRDILETADSAVAATTEEAQECSLALKNCGLVTANLEEQNEALADRLAASQKLNAEQGRTLEILRAARQGKPILPWAIAATSIVLVIAALVL